MNRRDPLWEPANLNHDRPTRSHRLGWNLTSLFLAFCFILATTAVVLTAEQPPSEVSLPLPPAQVHPLPQTLAQWNETQNRQGDYFDQVKPTQPGYLIWSHSPIQVYIAPLPTGTLLKPELWRTAVAQAVKDWQPYLPLSIIDTPAEADIHISANPPQNRSGARVRSAETHYELYVKGDLPTLAHRIRIYIRPNQTAQYLSAAARHELGHGLGLWGHSQTSTDVMYFAQVRVPPAISARDINTLKRVYQQPTRLGWSLSDDRPEKNPSLKAE